MIASEPPLSRAEIDAWLESLGETPRQRITVLRDLLKHAPGDEMTAADRDICRKELGRLLTQHHTAPPPQREEPQPCHEA